MQTASASEPVATLTVQITRAATGEVETFTVPASVVMADPTPTTTPEGRDL